MEWGREIEVNGARPAWLADDVEMCFRNTAVYRDRDSEARKVEQVMFGGSETCVTSIRLPADHFAYKAINAGFEPWGGGGTAPADWDGGEVLYSSGSVSGSASWAHLGKWLQEGYAIIGYRKSADPVSDPDTVTIKRMTEAEAARWMAERTIHGSAYREVLEHLGLIRPETRVERIARETGVSLADVEKVLAAQ